MSQRAKNRAEFPGVASIVDQVRAVYPNAQFLHGEENGREIGKFPSLPAGVVEVDVIAMEMMAMGMQKKRRRK